MTTPFQLWPVNKSAHTELRNKGAVLENYIQKTCSAYGLNMSFGLTVTVAAPFTNGDCLILLELSPLQTFWKGEKPD